MKGFLIIFLIILSGRWSFYIGYGETELIYNDSGRIDNMPLFSVFNFSIKQNHFLKRIKKIEFDCDLEYKFSKWTYFINNPYGDHLTSGFSPQDVTFLMGIKKDILKGNIGFQYDAGPPPGLMVILTLNNSDRQDALIFGIGVEKKFSSSIYMGEIKYIFTFPGKIAFYEPFSPYRKIEYKYDSGDHLIFNSKMEYKTGLISFGLDFIYRYKTRSFRVNMNTGEKDEFGDSYHFSIFPFLKLNFFKLFFEINTSISDEYSPFGLSIYGKNSVVFLPGKCVTFVLSYEY
ncbi:MAG: hypothetical protein ABIN17_06035 [candidate division WOR-3 bacterium]